MKTMLFNPYTGKPRDPLDISSDPEGVMVVEPDAPLVAAPVVREEPKPARILRLLNEAQALCTHITTLAEALEFRREAYDLSKSEFSAVLGVSVAHYGEILNGRRDIPKGAMRRAYAIGVPAGALLQPAAQKA